MYLLKSRNSVIVLFIGFIFALGGYICQSNTVQQTNTLTVNIKNYVRLVNNDDWTNAIQTALKELPNKGTLVFPNDIIYNVSDKIVCSDKEIHIIGDNTQFVEKASLHTPVFLFTNTNNSSVEGVVCQGDETLTDFFGTSDKIYSFFEFIDSRNVTINNIVIYNKTYGIYLNKCNDCVIKDIICKGFLTSGNLTTKGANYSAGVVLSGGNKCSIDNLNCSNMGAAVLIGKSGSYHTLSNITGNHLRDNGIYLSSAIQCSITNAKLNDIVSSGIKLRGRDNIISNCFVSDALIGYTMTGTGKADSYGFNGYNNTVTDSKAENCTVMGVAIVGQDDSYGKSFKILNNTLIKCGKGGTMYPAIRIDGGSEHQIIGNTILGTVSDVAILVQGNKNNLSNHITVSENKITGDGHKPLCGIRSIYTTESTFYHNSFENLGACGIEGRYLNKSLIKKNVYDNGRMVLLNDAYPCNDNRIM